jgi:hypothetical protein
MFRLVRTDRKGRLFFGPFPFLFVYYSSKKREVNRRLTYECRCDERLKVKVRDRVRDLHVSHKLVRLRGELEHLKMETRLMDERFASVMGECVILTSQVHRRYLK